MTSVTEIVLILLLITVSIVFWRRRHAAKAAARPDLTRLVRIKNVSFIFSLLIWANMVFGGYCFLAFIFHWPNPFSDGWRIVVAPGHAYAAVTEMPANTFWLFVVKVGLMFFCAGILLRLFWLYQRGIFFTAKNVNCIRFLGYYLIVNCVVDYQLQSTLHDVNLSLTPVFIGLLVIFVAWIMDEGRKIQEEQELTV